LLFISILRRHYCGGGGDGKRKKELHRLCIHPHRQTFEETNKVGCQFGYFLLVTLLTMPPSLLLLLLLQLLLWLLATSPPPSICHRS
jgi:hypothetical protein